MPSACLLRLWLLLRWRTEVGLGVHFRIQSSGEPLQRGELMDSALFDYSRTIAFIRPVPSELEAPRYWLVQHANTVILQPDAPLTHHLPGSSANSKASAVQCSAANEWSGDGCDEDIVPSRSWKSGRTTSIFNIFANARGWRVDDWGQR